MILRTQHSICALALGHFLALSAGCGSNHRSGAEALTQASQDNRLAAPNTAWTRRFDQGQIDAVYSSEVNQGKPVSKPPVYVFFDNQNQAPDLAREFGPFNRAATLQAYINLDQDPLFLAPTRWIVAMEAISGWTKIRNTNGEAIFKEAYSIDPDGKRIPDEVNGELPPGGKTHFGRVRMPVSVATLTADLQVQLEDNGSWLGTRIVNVRDIRAPLVGTIIKAGGFRIVLELFPYQKGFLVYGVTAARLDQFADQMTPEALGSQIGAILSWLSSQLLGQRTLASNAPQI